MSTWKRFYYAWGGFAAVLGIVILIVVALPSAIPYAAGVLVPLLLLFGFYGAFVVRCPKCGVRLTETVFVHGLPRESCPLCLHDLTLPEEEMGRR